MSTALAVRDQLIERLRSDDFKEQVALALPEHISPDRFVRATVTAIMQNPDVLKADRASLFQGVIKSAQDGLVPDGREAALVIFGKTVQYLPMIAGLRKIAADHGWSIRTAVAYENDEFEFELGLDQRLVHRPTRPGMDRGRPVAAYAVGSHRDGRREFVVMDAGEIEQVRQVSRAKNSGPWVEWWDRMWEKTVGHRLFSKLPLGDLDDARLARMQVYEHVPPAEASRLLYGGNGAAPALPPAADSEEPGANETSLPASVPQTGASASPLADNDVSADAGAPAPSSEPESPYKAPVPLTPEVVAANEAGEVPLPFGKKKGHPLRDADEGSIRWGLRKWETEPFRSSLWAYAQIYHADLVEAVLQEQKAAEEVPT